jgi:hypothetical protein
VRSPQSGKRNDNPFTVPTARRPPDTPLLV